MKSELKSVKQLPKTQLGKMDNLSSKSLDKAYKPHKQAHFGVNLMEQAGGKSGKAVSLLQETLINFFFKDSPSDSGTLLQQHVQKSTLPEEQLKVQPKAQEVVQYKLVSDGPVLKISYGPVMIQQKIWIPIVTYVPFERRQQLTALFNTIASLPADKLDAVEKMLSEILGKV